MLWPNFCLFIPVLFAECVSANERCKVEINIQGMRLEKFVFKRMSASAPYICDIRCGEEIICQSYNYNRKKEICELNNRTKEARPENFRSAPDWFYIRRLNGRDIDECKSNISLCSVNANCSNTYGSYKCTCKEGYNGTGYECRDIDECRNGSHLCDANANCINIKGSYNCTCKKGFLGDGQICSDIDECVNDSFICGVNATCVNTNGSYGCTCKEEESVEDGGFCSGKECRSIVFKEPIRDKVMKGHLIRLVDVPHQGSCNVLCYLEPNCVSINFGPSQGGNYICELNNASDESQGSSYLQSKQDHTYLSIENPCSSSPCFNNGTCQAGYTEKGFRCKCPLGFTGVNCKKACSFDFEDGIGAWEMTGRAFIYQPTFGDNPKARKRESAQQQGDWWIGDCERRPAKSDPAGKQHIDGCDPPVGTLTSPCFRIVGKMISFLIGGGCKVNKVRAELIVNNQVVRKETGNCIETMYRKSWDVEEFIGQYAQVRLVDESSGSWSHINFDDLKGDIICPHY